jgi:DNA-binding response OmpR family regulator
MGQLNKYTVLFLEDNQEFAENFSQSLEMQSYKIIHVNTLEDAWKIYKQKHIDIIISDIKVHHENGLDFIKKVRVSDKETPVVILSAFKDEAFLFEAIGLNILSYELKPLSYKNFSKLLFLMLETLKANKKVYLKEDVYYNFNTKELYIKEIHKKLTKRETLFLELLLKKKSTLSHEDIQEFIWQGQEMSISARKNFLMRFRKKLPSSLITTINNVGYKLNFQ